MEQQNQKESGQPGGDSNSENMARRGIVLRFVIPSIAVVSFLAMVVGSWFLYRTWDFLNVPPESQGRKINFIIEPGQTLWQVSTNLAKAGLIKDSKRFRGYAQAEKKGGNVRAGEFNLYTNMTAPEVLTEITTTSGILHKLSVREGLNWWQTAKIAEEAGLTTYSDFKKAVYNRELIKKYNIPADNLEGYLFPETYMLTRPQKETGTIIAETMVREFFKAAHKAWPDGLPSPKKIHETLILASLVEKETGDISERRTIAGVFANRLRKGYLLQSDPTIIYGLGEDFDGNLHKSQLQDKTNTYNTYRHRGLPPGPICSPGLASIEAAINPEKNNYLYFVAKGDGSHYFSRSLKEHNNAVKKYQLRRNRKTYRSY